MEECLDMYYKGEKVEMPSGNSNDFHGEGENIRRELSSILLSNKKGLKVLDIGTGFGRNASFLSKILPQDRKIWTLDPSEEVLTNAEKLLRESGLSHDVTFVKGTTEELPFDDNFFDAVVSVVVLHHLKGLEQALKEMLRVLKSGIDGGKLVLIDWSPESHVLPFSNRHEKSDFFEPEKVAVLLKNLGASSNTKKFHYWYVVEATK